MTQEPPRRGSSNAWPSNGTNVTASDWESPALKKGRHLGGNWDGSSYAKVGCLSHHSENWWKFFGELDIQLDLDIQLGEFEVFEGSSIEPPKWCGTVQQDAVGVIQQRGRQPSHWTPCYRAGWFYNYKKTENHWGLQWIYLIICSWMRHNMVAFLWGWFVCCQMQNYLSNKIHKQHPHIPSAPDLIHSFPSFSTICIIFIIHHYHIIIYII